MDFPRCMELSEIVRQYILAYMIVNHGFLPVREKTEVAAKPESNLQSYSDISADRINVDISEFGKVSRKAVEERVKTERTSIRVHNRKVEKEIAKEEGEGTLASDYAYIVKRNPTPSPATLAKLAKRATQALAEARELAGEGVIYCCAAIRKESIHDCFAECQRKEAYRDINRRR